jgi:hypothetical protein
MSLTNVGRAYGGADGSPERTEVCEYIIHFFFPFSFCTSVITNHLGGIELCFKMKEISWNPLTHV